MAELRIDYDDQATDVIDKVNDALASIGWRFMDDDKVHDGSIFYSLERIGEAESK